MQNTQTREILFSFNDPYELLHSLQLSFQEIRRSVTEQTTFPMSLHGRTVLVIDADSPRANVIASVLSTAGYHPFIATSALEAFTLFLRGAFVPFVILFGRDDTKNRFFLSRLLQQMSQKYQWDTPIITILTATNTSVATNTESLTPTKRSQLELTALSEGVHSSLSTQTTAPLPHRNDAPHEQPSEVKRIEQIPFPPIEYSPPLSNNITPAEPIINVSTHEASQERTNNPRISLEGTSIGRYHMKAFLGEGALGQVYQTYDRLREQDVALKAVQINTLPAEMGEDINNEKNLFQQEIDLLRMLNHPHLLLPLNCGKSYISGSPFIYKTMPHITTGSLATRVSELDSARLLAPQDVRLIISQIAEALQHLHSFKITYQNFKLSNFLVDMQGKKKNQLHIFLTDFVIVHNRTFLIKGPDVFPYMAPECWNGRSMEASDQYGLAAIAYELLTGRVLFQGQSEQIMRQLHMNMQPLPPSLLAPHLPERINSVVMRALSKRVEDRFSSVMDFAKALQQSLM